MNVNLAHFGFIFLLSLVFFIFYWDEFFQLLYSIYFVVFFSLSLSVLFIVYITSPLVKSLIAAKTLGIMVSVVFDFLYIYIYRTIFFVV